MSLLSIRTCQPATRDRPKAASFARDISGVPQDRGEYRIGVTGLFECQEFDGRRRFWIVTRAARDAAQQECKNRP